MPLWLEQSEKRLKEIGMPVELSMPDSEQPESPPIGDNKQYLVRMYAGEGVGAYPVGGEP